MLTYITRQQDMIDDICRRHYGSHDGGTVEAVLNANPALALQPPILPAGIAITLPDIVPPSAATPVRLWD